MLPVNVKAKIDEALGDVDGALNCLESLEHAEACTDANRISESVTGFCVQLLRVVYLMLSGAGIEQQIAPSVPKDAAENLARFEKEET